MKLTTNLLSIFAVSCWLSISTSAATVTLTANNNFNWTNSVQEKVDSEIINIGSNQIARVLYFGASGFYKPFANFDTSLVVTISTNQMFLNYGVIHGGSTSPHGSGLPVIRGPASFQLHWNDESMDERATAYCTIEITSTDPEVTPSGAVVIPADASGPVEIVLESSSDMVSWVPTQPGLYGSSTEKRFFRVRALKR